MDKIDTKAINTIRVLCADIVQKANSGHPGAPMGCAPILHLLYSKYLNHNPSDLKWFNRDRFVMSNGHSCALLYSMLHLNGYNISLDDLKQFRKVSSKTPGHPESIKTDGVEVTTGPLGQGFANSVGLAIASKNLASIYNKEGYDIFNCMTYCLCGDGCLQEGVSCEAASLAGHLKLDNLIVMYDDNNIQIDGDTEMAFTEDVEMRFRAYKWDVYRINNVDEQTCELDKLLAKLKGDKNRTKPVFIIIKTTIGCGSKNQGKEKVHGSPLGDEDIVSLKKNYGFDTEKHFVIDQDVYDHYNKAKQSAESNYKKWNDLFKRYKTQHPQLAKELEGRFNKQFSTDIKSLLPTYNKNDPALATRKASENVLNAIAKKMPELIGGSADLTPSTLTRWKDAVDFQHKDSKLGDYSGRYIRYGVREHSMAAISNGIHAFGGYIPFAATFLNFIGYALGAVRLSCLGNHQVIYIATHDSIGLGEDGPTHQPLEILAALRSLPNMLVLRPADGNETSGAYYAALQNKDGPSIICLSRQNVPQLDQTSVENTQKGAYIVHKADKPKLVLVGTGTEVSICIDTAKLLEKEHNINSLVVSMPCQELFEKQDVRYRHDVFPKDLPVMSVEASTTYGWPRYAHACLGVDVFGESGPYKDVYEHFELTPQHISKKCVKLVKYYNDHPVPHLLDKPRIH